ncbi:hypothetical protein MTO96_042875 [Rhipicephalus appendiculatus]
MTSCSQDLARPPVLVDDVFKVYLPVPTVIACPDNLAPQRGCRVTYSTSSWSLPVREFVLQRYLRKHRRRHERLGTTTPVPVLERRPPATWVDSGIPPSGVPVSLPATPASPTPVTASSSATSPSDTPLASDTSSAPPVRARQPILARDVLRVYLPAPPNTSLF